jgi:phenylacetate-CoA ligase
VARPDVDAVLVPPGDAAALGRALHDVVLDAGLAERLVTAGAARAEDFSMVSLAEQYEAIYERVLAAPPAAAPSRRWGRRAS